MPEKRVSEILEAIGFKKNEVLIYLYLLKTGEASISDISKGTGIHRSNTHDLVEGLLSKGIVDETIINEKKYYYPIEPEDLLDYLKQKQKKLEEVIPQLEKTKNTKQDRRKVSLSEGVNSVKNILNHLLDLKEPISAYGIPKELDDILGGFLGEYHRRRIKRKIPLRIIFETKGMNQMKKLNKMDFTEARYLPLKHTHSSTIICREKIILITWESPITTIIIESKNISDAYKEYFEIIWKEAEELFNSNKEL